MARRRLATPHERERIDGSSKTRIIRVDKENGTVYMQINACNVSVVCREKNDPGAYEGIKEIMINSVLRGKQLSLI